VQREQTVGQSASSLRGELHVRAAAFSSRCRRGGARNRQHDRRLREHHAGRLGRANLSLSQCFTFSDSGLARLPAKTRAEGDSQTLAAFSTLSTSGLQVVFVLHRDEGQILRASSSCLTLTFETPTWRSCLRAARRERATESANGTFESGACSW